MSADPIAPTAGARRGIRIILLIALSLRLGWGMTRPVNPASIDALPDQREYLDLASNLLHGRGLEFLDRRFDDTVRAFRTPGYPLFLAACGANVRVIRAVQAVLDTSTILAIQLLAEMLLPIERRRFAGAVAAALLAVNPYLIYFSGLILSETLFTAMLAWSLVLLVRGGGGSIFHGRRSWVWLAGAILAGASVLVRPSAVALPIVLGIAASFLNREERRSYEPIADAPRRRLPVGAVTAALTCILLLPWGLRNFVVLGRWVWLDTNSGFTMYDGYNPDATGGSDQRFVEREPELQVLSETDRDDYLAAKAREYARTHPGRDVQLAIARLGRTWSPMPLSEDYGRPLYRAIALAYSLPFDLLALGGLLGRGLDRRAKFLLLAPVVYFTIVHALTVGSLRYRIPVEPLLAVLAASFVAAWTEPREFRRQPAF